MVQAPPWGGSKNLSELIDSFASICVGVIGDGMLDSYLLGSSVRLCREAPVPAVKLSERRDSAGGAANAAVNLRALGAKVSFLSVIGNDSEGRTLKQLLKKHGVSTKHLLLDESRHTLTKNRVIADSQLLVRFDTGDTSSISEESEHLMVKHMEDLFQKCDAILISDYGYGVITSGVVKALQQLQHEHSLTLVADARNVGAYREVGLTAVKPNFTEAINLLDTNDLNELSRAEFIQQQGNRLLAASGARIAAITLDVDGAIILERGSPPHRITTQPSPNLRATGAGDTFVSALTLGLASGASAQASGELASAAARIVIGKEGTAACTADELRDYFRGKVDVS